MLHPAERRKMHPRVAGRKLLQSGKPLGNKASFIHPPAQVFPSLDDGLVV